MIHQPLNAHTFVIDSESAKLVSHPNFASACVISHVKDYKVGGHYSFNTSRMHLLVLSIIWLLNFLKFSLSVAAIFSFNDSAN